MGDDLRKMLVQNQACFSKLTPNEIEAISELLIEKRFNKGDIIVKQGDVVDSVFFIVSGTADVQRAFIEDGKMAIKSLAKLGADQSIGLSETGFYSLSGVRTATVVAETEIYAFRLSIAAFNGYALANPHVNEVMRRNEAST